MTHSNLTSVVIHSPNGYFPRSDKVRKITIHHMAGVMTAEQCGYVFSSSARQASSNYGIGNDGKIACYVEEENAAWTSSSYWNDNQAITLEVSNSYAGDPWPISDAAWYSMIKLCADICIRYGITPSYTGGTDGTFTEHRMFAPTGCPGEYIHARMNQIVREVKARMNGTGGTWVKSDKNGKWWYKYPEGSWPASKWEKINNKWYYFDSEGYMFEGWLSYSGHWYYLKPNDGDMQIGWLTLKGKKYYFNSEGEMATGFKQIKSIWYCFNKDGALVTDDAKIVVASNGKITIK